METSEYALIKDGRVVNVVVVEKGDQATVDMLAGADDVDEAVNVDRFTKNRPGPGWEYDGSTFVRPEPPAEPELPEPATPEPEPTIDEVLEDDADFAALTESELRMVRVLDKLMQARAEEQARPTPPDVTP